MNYFPTSPIPDWPKRGRNESIPHKESAAMRKFFSHSTEQFNRASAAVRSQLFRNGEPMICLSCGRATAEDGETVCGH